MPTRYDTSLRSFIKEKKYGQKLLSRFSLGPAGSKYAVILAATLCWLLVVVVRSSAPQDTGSLEASSLIGLAKTMQDGSVSGRDFHSLFGAGTQLVAWLATVAAGASPLDAYGTIVFFFCLSSAML